MRTIRDDLDALKSDICYIEIKIEDGAPIETHALAICDCLRQIHNTMECIVDRLELLE